MIDLGMHCLCHNCSDMLTTLCIKRISIKEYPIIYLFCLWSCWVELGGGMIYDAFSLCISMRNIGCTWTVLCCKHGNEWKYINCGEGLWRGGLNCLLESLLGVEDFALPV